MEKNDLHEEKRKYIIERRKRDVSMIGIEDYANRPFYEKKDACIIVASLIDSNESFLVGRIGETEMRTIREYSSGRWLKRSCRIASHCVCNNAGFFPNNPISINKFCKKYIDAMYQIDYLGLFAWQAEEEYMEKSANLKWSFSANILDVLRCEYKWTEALKGKKVLVISPFAQTIQNQFAHKELIWPLDKNILPDFELLTYKAVQSVGGKGTKDFKSWFEALAFMEEEINLLDFEIALIGCGAYGLPLGAYIKNLGRKAIVVGGCLQLLFGILGKRWENDPIVNSYKNQYWVRPAEFERPALTQKVEEGCYW